MLKKVIKSVLPKSIINLVISFRNNYLDGFALKSYSQEGEDMILRRMLERQQAGFYIDIGAHHPKRFSNTYYFYKRGWRGINIDAMPGSMKLFQKFRPRDINLEIAIYGERRKLKYHIFNDLALNTFSYELAKQRDGLQGYKIIGIKEIETVPLREVLNKYLPKVTVIDFLNIDVEGLDLEVLKSNDWTKYRPRIILVELNTDVKNLFLSEIYKFMKELNYTLFAKTFRTAFFKAKEKQL